MPPARSPLRVCCYTAILWAITTGLPVFAHAVGESYVWLNVEENRFSGRVEINLDDIREKLGINVPTAESDGDQRQSVLEANREAILKYVEEHFQITDNGSRVPVTYDPVRIRDLTEEEGNYARYDYVTPPGTVPDSITLRNSLFCEGDPLHRSLVCIEKNAKSGQEFEGEFVAMVFGSHNPEQELDLTNIDSLLRPRDFVWQGVLHIWIGTDHILFIVALLLPAVLIRKEGKWEPVPNFKDAFFSILKIVTIFTVAHSITLSLAALGLIDLESRLVESVIALSIILVAANTIRPKFNDKTWLIIFGFGLFHGMGFASVMSDLPFRMIHLVKVLIGFNVGVELGQLAIVAVIFPIIYLMRSLPLYQPAVLKAGSAFIGLIACVWFIERACDIEIFAMLDTLMAMVVTR
ncbi:MAG: HupE/UreJ family protein [Planctomycetota bacterium]